MWARIARLLFAVGLPVFFLWLFFRSIDIHQLRNAVAGVSWWGWSLLVIAALVQIVHLVLRSARWRIMLRPMKPEIGFYNLFSTVSIGYLVTMLLPGRIGEVLRPVLLASRERIGKSGALATVLLERIIDGICIVVLLAAYLIFFMEPMAGEAQVAAEGMARSWGVLLGALMVLALPVLWGLVHFRKKAAAVIEAVYPASKPGGVALRTIFHGIVDGFEVLKGGRALIGVWAYSIVIWVLIAFSIWFSLLAFEIRIPIAGSVLMLAALAFGIAIPTQGGVGTYEFFGQQALVLFFGVDQTQAGAAILVLHIFAISPTIILGLIFVWKEGLSFQGLKDQARSVKDNSPSGPDGTPRAAEIET
jgi:hypothetical protein